MNLINVKLCIIIEPNLRTTSDILSPKEHRQQCSVGDGGIKISLYLLSMRANPGYGESLPHAEVKAGRSG